MSISCMFLYFLIPQNALRAGVELTVNRLILTNEKYYLMTLIKDICIFLYLCIYINLSRFQKHIHYF